LGQAELLIAGLLVAVAGLGALARMLAVPYPIVLVVGGALLGFIPGMPEIRLNPNIVLVVFLPLLVYGAAFFANLTNIRSNLRAVTLSSIGLVLATMAAVAVVAHAVIDGLPWGAAFALGAIVSPTDPLAGAAIMRRLELPRGLVNGIEAEGLFNDADRAGGLQGGRRRRRGRHVLDPGRRMAVSGRRRRRGGHRPGRRVGHRGVAGADERRADERDDLTVQRLCGVHPGQRDRGIRGAGGGHDRGCTWESEGRASSRPGSGCRATSYGRCWTSY
jgi:hypothetical protein